LLVIEYIYIYIAVCHVIETTDSWIDGSLICIIIIILTYKELLLQQQQLLLLLYYSS
jgi:hypothetical protein